MSPVLKELINGVLHARDARKVLEDLRERFDKVNTSGVYQLHKAITTITQGIDCVSVYLSKLKNLWDEFDSMVPPPCDCARSKNIIEFMQKQKVLQFLMGLNNNYEHARSQILITSPTPSNNKLYSMLVKRESQKLVDNTSVVGERIDLAALLAGKRENYQNHQKPKRRWNVENLDPNFVSIDDRRGEIPEAIKEGNWQRASQLTADQYDQIMKLLNEDPPNELMANMEGTTYSFMAKIAKGNWIVDTGATNHMVADLGMLIDVKDISPTKDKRVHLSIGDCTIVSHIAERKHRHLLEVARTFILQGHIPMEFWGHCVLAAAYVINRLPSHALDNKSPYDLFFGWKPSISHLKTLGCLCFASTLPRTDKFSSRAIETVFMGYSGVTKGYILYDLDRHKFFVNRDVVFREFVFPFQAINDDFRKQINPCISNTTDDEFRFEGANTDVHVVAIEQLYVSDENTDDIIPDIADSEAITSFPPPPIVDTYPNSLRRSQRKSKEPVWLRDYVTTRKSINTVLYPIHNYVSYDHLSPSYQAYLGVFSSVVEPITLQEASKDARCVEAMQAKIQALQDNKT
ncbi:uncharacterized protein [Nicotiana sylvestris]|uniref:uncharacterized protein n=1 Tax=Nicotiana sylvestris TaxID=4096 RepID=UPI00388C9786